MNIEENRNLLFSDTLLPDIFITDYMPILDGLAVKIYVYGILVARSKKDVPNKDFAARFGTDTETVKAALAELASYGLIDFTDKGFVITDIKAKEIDKIYKPKTSQMPSQIIKENITTEREKMISDISKTFFSGIMSPSWYCEIDNWFSQYRFDPQVVYALFNECMRRKKLDSKAYISKVALNWSKQGIVSYDDLNRYFLTYDKVIKLSKKVGQKLRKNITEYDEEIVAVWVDKMKYDFDIVDIALKKTSKLSNPNLEYANKLLEEWFSKGLVTTEQIVEYEKEKQLKFFSEKKKQEGNFPNTKNTRSNVGNFDQREYSDEYHEQMLLDVTSYSEKLKSEKPD